MQQLSIAIQILHSLGAIADTMRGQTAHTRKNQHTRKKGPGRRHLTGEYQSFKERNSAQV